MIARVLDKIKAHIWPITYGFLLLISINVGHQIYTHLTTPLTPWKGGGFGMYTEPHNHSRSVWVELHGVDANGEAAFAEVRLYPKLPLMDEWQASVSRKGAQALQRLYTNTENMRFYPRDFQAEGAINAVDPITWPEDFVGDIKPMEGSTFDPDAIEIVVYEKHMDRLEAKIKQREIYRYKRGAE